MVSRKSSGDFAARTTFALVLEVGCAQIEANSKSDIEPAMMELVGRVGRLRTATPTQPIAVETILAYASTSHGIVERSVKLAQDDHMRALRAAAEVALGVLIATRFGRRSLSTRGVRANERARRFACVGRAVASAQAERRGRRAKDVKPRSPPTLIAAHDARDEM